jgi:hypothetical protein
MSRPEMPTPQNSAIAIDYQPAMYQSVQPHDRLETFNNIQNLAKAAKGLMSFANGKVKVLAKNEAVRASPWAPRRISAIVPWLLSASTSLAENWMRSMGNLVTGTMNGAEDRNGTLT